MKVLHNGCNTVTCAHPDMFTLSPRAEDGHAMPWICPPPALSPRACGPRILGVHIRQSTHACVTTIKYLCTRIIQYMYIIIFTILMTVLLEYIIIFILQ